MSAAKYGERSIYQRVQVTSAPGAVLDGGSSGQVARNLLARVERPPDLFCCQSRVWVSRPGTRHSRNLTARPDVAIAIYDSHRPGGWSALYMTAVAEELENVDVALRGVQATVGGAGAARLVARRGRAAG